MKSLDYDSSGNESTEKKQESTVKFPKNILITFSNKNEISQNKEKATQNKYNPTPSSVFNNSKNLILLNSPLNQSSKNDMPKKALSYHKKHKIYSYA